MDEKLSDDKGRRRSLLGQRITSGMSTLQKKILKKSRSNMLVECPDLEKSKLSGYLNVKLPDELIFHRKKCVLIDQTLYMFKKDSNIPHHALYINHGTEISPTPKSKVNSFQHSVGNLRLSQRPQITQFIADTQLDMVTWIDALVRAPLPIKLRQPLIPIKSLSRSSAVIQEEQLSSLKLLLSGESQKSHLGLKTTSLSTNSSNSDDSTGRVELSQAKFLPVRSEY
ncbi:hypothetical protein BC833DRAFT_383097 [Globomyces pollinis-pini]|nr:hypothetical protein BC833DRAFT_383097 [Globomyces pollinis-pini]